jgi:L-lactate utilization protein LutB
MTHPSRRMELCNQVHTDLGDLIIESKGMLSHVVIPMITEEKAEAVCVANYLRGVGYTVELHEEMKDFLYELLITWN